DAIEKGIVSEDQFFSEVGVDPPRIEHKPLGPNARFLAYKIITTRQLTEQASKLFVENIEEILNGTHDRALLDSDKTSKKTVETLKDFAKRFVFLSREAVEVELRGFHIV